MIGDHVQRLWLSYVWLVSPSLESCFSSLSFDPTDTNIGDPSNTEFHLHPYPMMPRRMTITLSSTLFLMVELTGDSNTDDDDKRANYRGIHECD